MPGYVAVYELLLRTTLAGCVLLGLAWLAVMLLRQPARRIRVIELTLVGLLSLPLIATFGFLSKAVDRLLEKAVRHTGVTDIVCIAHEDCGGYKAEHVKLVDTAFRRAAGDSIRDLQIDHLRKAARRLQLGLRGTRVRAFYADVTEAASQQHVRFTEVSLERS